jgi:hypothetical protein
MGFVIHWCNNKSGVPFGYNTRRRPESIRSRKAKNYCHACDSGIIRIGLTKCVQDKSQRSIGGTTSESDAETSFEGRYSGE